MARTVNVHDAKTNFSKLLVDVEAGEEIVIARAGKPCARLVPVVEPVDRRLGTMKNIWPDLPEEFFAPMSTDELADWGG